MNDPALAAVIFVEQPEGLCGLTKTVRLSTRVISAFTVDREGTNLNEAALLFPFTKEGDSDDPGTNTAGPRDDQVRGIR